MPVTKPVCTPSACLYTILIVEDDEAIREGLRAALEFEDYIVVTASNGHEAIEALKTMNRPCLILLDLMMPVMNGWDFLKYRRQDDLLMTIPVAIVSAATDKALGAAVGAQTILKKPIDLHALLQWIRIYCGVPPHAEQAPERDHRSTLEIEEHALGGED